MLTSAEESYVEVTDNVISEIADKMRQSDKDEVWASSRSTPHEAVVRSIYLSDWWAVVKSEDIVLGVVGVAEIPDDGMFPRAAPWFLGTDEVDTNPKAFVKAVKQIVVILSQRYSVLTNYVHAENEKAIRLLRHLGFKIKNTPDPVGAGGELFYRFEKSNVQCANLQH